MPSSPRLGSVVLAWAKRAPMRRSPEGRGVLRLPYGDARVRAVIATVLAGRLLVDALFLSDGS